MSKRCCYGQNCVAMDLKHKEKALKSKNLTIKSYLMFSLYLLLLIHNFYRLCRGQTEIKMVENCKYSSFCQKNWENQLPNFIDYVHNIDNCHYADIIYFCRGRCFFLKKGFKMYLFYDNTVSSKTYLLLVVIATMMSFH